MEIENGDIIPFYSEYMETDKVISPGFGMVDVFFVYGPGNAGDRPNRNSKQVAKKHPNNIYAYINRSLTAAADDRVVVRLMRFLNSSFYDNSYAMTCTIAGLGLALVGENVDRDFCIIWPGGAGRSLFTSLLRNSLRSMRGFFDCTSLYLDDEVRNTLEHIVGYCVLTSLEGADGGSTNLRNPRQDSRKKIFAGGGGPISRRLPYAKTSKMVSIPVC